MPEVISPNAPATKKQLSELSNLTGRDYSSASLNRQQAHELALEIKERLSDKKPEYESTGEYPDGTILWKYQTSEGAVSYQGRIPPYTETDRTTSRIRPVKFVDNDLKYSIQVVGTVKDDIDIVDLGWAQVAIATDVDGKSYLEYVKPDGKKPFTQAEVTLIEAPQGGGKSVTATARSIVDPYFKDCARIYFSEVLKLDYTLISYNWQTRVAKMKTSYGEVKYIAIPKEYKLRSTLKIFCNYHLYGIPYVYCPSFRHILKWIKNGFIRDGILIIDEAYMGMNVREGMGRLGRELAKQNNQFRKMKLKVVLITPMGRLLDWTARLIPTEHITCEFNDATGEVTLNISKKEKGRKIVKEVTYDSRPYRRFYWTNERINN